ncbi:MAG TPA: carbohydrate kinase [Terriglobia bacterium]|nr:carbohydrate kinase [Terriglobia bacterium]
MKRPLDLLCLGEMLIDFVPVPAGSSLNRTRRLALAPGGAPANVAVAARRLGLGTGFIGSVGDDPFGRLLRDVLLQQDVDLSLFHLTRDSLTRLAFVTNDADERQRFLFYGNPGADVLLRPKDIRAGYLKSARAFHFGSISLIQDPAHSATLAAIAQARRFGLIISFDPNLRPHLWPSLRQAKRQILKALKFCQVLKLSDSEWEFLFPGQSFQTGLDQLWETGVQLVAMTLGGKGAMVANRQAIVKVEALPIKVVDTTGAGDGFMAGLILGILQKGTFDLNRFELLELTRLATVVGSLTCRRAGAIPGFPSLREVKENLRSLR